jgi:hypothetical protein
VAGPTPRAGAPPSPPEPPPGTRRIELEDEEPSAPAAPAGLLVSDTSAAALARFRDAFDAEIKRTQPAAIYAMVFAQARHVEVSPLAVTFVYDLRSKTIAAQFEALRPALDDLATGLAGRPLKVTARDEGPSAKARPSPAADAAAEKERLKAEVMKEPVVQTLLEVFPSDIRDVTEIEDGK